MAYASIEDVQARAGAIRRAWTSTSTPSLDEIEAFLDTAASRIDLLLTARGYGTPAAASYAEALREPNADRALVLALDATFPGGAAPAEVDKLRDAAEARWEDEIGKLEDGTHPVILALLGADSPQASSLWTTEPDYDPNRAGLAGTFNRHLDPVIRRGMLL